MCNNSGISDDVERSEFPGRIRGMLQVCTLAAVSVPFLVFF